MANGEEFVGAHKFVSLEGTTDKNGYPFCKDCLKTESDGNHIPVYAERGSTTQIHEFEWSPGTMATTGRDDYILAVCDICGDPADSPLHYHEFRLAFGEFYCAICLEKVDAPQHKGVNMDGITERPVREVEPLVSNEEFWDKVQADERLEKKRTFFPTFGSSTTAGKISIEEEPESVDTLISRANLPIQPLKSEELNRIPEAPKNPHSFFTKGDKVVMGGIVAGLVANCVLSVYSLLN